MKICDLSLIIPSYNEAKKIGKDINQAFLFFKKSRIKAEVIVCANGTTDKTIEIVRNLQKKYKNLKLIDIKQRIGKGGAIKAGFKIARGKVIMFADAGLCIKYEYINKGLDILNKGFDIAIADRSLKESRVKNKVFYRKLGSIIFSLIARYLLGISKNLTDTQCGFKLYKARIGKDLYAKLLTNGMMFDIEVLLRAQKRNLRIKNFPVSWKGDKFSSLNSYLSLYFVIKELILLKLVYKI